MTIRFATAADAGLLADIHRAAFDTPWREEDIAALMQGPGGFALVAESQGFILCRAIAGEAEILTLAVDPTARRNGLGRALVEAAAGVAIEQGADLFFLEVAEDNAPAIGLYQAAGFASAGRRPGYYQRPGGASDALIMRRTLNTSG